MNLVGLDGTEIAFEFVEANRVALTPAGGVDQDEICVALFVAARLIARRQGCGEILWQPAAAAAGADD